MQLSENSSVSDITPELQLRCYLLRIFADMNRTINFDDMMFSEEDVTLMENFVAPLLYYLKLYR